MNYEVMNHAGVQSAVFGWDLSRMAMGFTWNGDVM
jgi:hypothetical protein